jgi:hypothetical protein
MSYLEQAIKEERAAKRRESDIALVFFHKGRIRFSRNELRYRRDIGFPRSDAANGAREWFKASLRTLRYLKAILTESDYQSGLARSV